MACATLDVLWLCSGVCIPGIPTSWALQGEIGAPQGTLGYFGLGTAGYSCGWALRGYSVLGFAGILCRRSVVGDCRDYSTVGYSAVGHCTEGEENINCLTSNILPMRVGTLDHEGKGGWVKGNM